MSYRRDKEEMQQRREEYEDAFKAKSFNFISLASGNVVTHADDPEDVVVIASDYRMNPDLKVVGYDALGRDAQEWTIAEILNGTFEADLA